LFWGGWFIVYNLIFVVPPGVAVGASGLGWFFEMGSMPSGQRFSFEWWMDGWMGGRLMAVAFLRPALGMKMGG
jgi:hypothetical protein